VPVKESDFDLVIEPGEMGAEFAVERAQSPGRKVVTPPVTLLRRSELLDRAQAREALDLPREGKLALFSLGPGNLKDVSEMSRGLIDLVCGHGFTAVWARAAISVRDVPLPEHVLPLSVYPLVRYLRAFDVLVSAAGYNACCEIVQSGVPSLLVPNTLLADDQLRRANRVSRQTPAVVFGCETAEEQREAVARLLELDGAKECPSGIRLDGAEHAADEILALATPQAAA
jgi:UDP:flavonoid glycosyltransferase YjiC (YdhE family)